MHYTYLFRAVIEEAHVKPALILNHKCQFYLCSKSLPGVPTQGKDDVTPSPLCFVPQSKTKVHRPVKTGTTLLTVTNT